MLRSCPRALVALLLLLCADMRSIAGAEPTAPGPGWTWSVRVEPDLSRLHVRLCFRDFRPRRLHLPVLGADAAIAPAPLQGERSGLRAVDGTWELTDAPGGDPRSPCVAYDVDLAALAALPGARAERVGGDLLMQPGSWLLVPLHFTPAEDARLELDLPSGLSASVPWPAAEGGGYRVHSHAFLFESRMAFGRFVPRALTIAGVRFDVALLDAPRRVTDAGIEQWLKAAGDAVGGLYGGRFPVPRVQVLIQPVRPGGDPVVFGRAFQAGGPAVHLLLSAAARDGDLPLEWIAVHELTHLGLPAIVAEDVWLSEGFVTYYQEVLRARAGHFGDVVGPWQALHEGFGRGRRRGSERSIAEDSATMHAQQAYHRVYWAGAALALRVDLALRAETAGRRSLDNVLRLWATDDIRARGGWRGLELLAEADRVLGTRACVASVRGPLESSAFPATDDLYAALGLGLEAGRVVFSRAPTHVALREAVGGRR